MEYWSLVVSLVAVAAVLFLCFLFSRFVAKKVSHYSNSPNIQVLERVPFSQDKGLAIARICGKYYLIGFSTSRIEILRELPAEEIQKEQPVFPENFSAIFSSVMKNGWGVRAFDKFGKKSGAGGEDGGQKKKKP